MSKNIINFLIIALFFAAFEAGQINSDKSFEGSNKFLQTSGHFSGLNFFKKNQDCENEKGDLSFELVSDRDRIEINAYVRNYFSDIFLYTLYKLFFAALGARAPPSYVFI